MWDQVRIDEQLQEVEAIRDRVIISGGLAWHLISPPHKEKKQLHDHKDVDVFVPPANRGFGLLAGLLSSRGFKRARTLYDDPSGSFYRFTKYTDNGKIMFDIFVEDVPSISLDSGYKIVEPKHLLSLYEGTHSSKDCLAVKAATELIEKGINPIGRSELVGEYLTRGGSSVGRAAG